MAEIYRHGKRLSEMEYHLTVGARVMNRVLDGNPERGRRITLDSLFDRMRRFALNAKVQEVREEHSTNIYVDLYVFHPDEFWQIVEETAMRNGFLARPPFSPPTEKSDAQADQ